MTITATYREPFVFEPRVASMPDGLTLAQMRNRMTLPPEFDAHGIICLNGHPVSRELWPMIKPKAPAITEVTFHCPPQGGGGDGKNAFAVVASIALMVATGWIAAGGIAKAGLVGGGWFASGSVSAIALAAGVSYAGSLLLSSLTSTPTISTSSSSRSNKGDAAAEGNVLEPNTPIPRVVGRRKVYPPLGSEPLYYFDGPDEIAEACYVLAGPHQISDVRLGAASITSLSDVEYETREGWNGDPLVDLLQRQSRTERVQAELRGHLVSEDDGRTLDVSNGTQTSALPQVQVVATRDYPDEHQLQITFTSGLSKSASETNLLRVPIRIRMRPVGGTWINLPELHFQAASVRQMRATISLRWVDDATVSPSAPRVEGFVEARIASPGQTEAPASTLYSANSYFYGSGSENYLTHNNSGTTNVRHVNLGRYTADIYLDRSVFSARRYEIEVKRGAAFEASNYTTSSYRYSGSVLDFFGYRGTSPGQIVMSRDGVYDTLYLLRSVSIWNEHPLPSRDLAAIAVRVRNRSTDQVSCVAGGYVRDWDGSAWSNWKVTDNPAPHLRDIFVGDENMDPVPADMLDNDGLVEWRQHCIDMGYTCNALLEDQTIDDASRLVAACGYAKPYMSDRWGIVRDYDRSSEAPVQMFTHRNMVGFQWTKAFPRLPEGFRVNFRDKTRDYDTTQISVFRPGFSDDSGRMEQVTYEGIVDEEDAIARAEYDLVQSDVRGIYYSFDCAAESIVCRRGDLVAVQHDMLSDWAGSGRVVDIETNSSGNITALRLDSSVSLGSSPYMDQVANLATEDNLALLGLRSGASIRRLGSVSTHAVTGSGDRIVFSPAIDPDGIEIGTLVATGLVSQETLRLIVFGITPRPNFEASVTLVDEAPQLWN